MVIFMTLFLESSAYNIRNFPFNKHPEQSPSGFAFFLCRLAMPELVVYYVVNNDIKKHMAFIFPSTNR